MLDPVTPVLDKLQSASDFRAHSTYLRLNKTTVHASVEHDDNLGGHCAKTEGVPALIQNLPDDIMHLIFAKIADPQGGDIHMGTNRSESGTVTICNDDSVVASRLIVGTAAFNLLRSSSALRKNDLILAYALPLITRRINGDKTLTQSAKSSTFMNYSAKIIRMPPKTQQLATRHLTENLNVEFPAAVKSLLREIERQKRKPISQRESIKHASDQIMCIMNLSPVQRTKSLSIQIDRLKNHRSNGLFFSTHGNSTRSDDFDEAFADLVAQAMGLSGMISLHERPGILGESLGLLEQIRDRDLPDLLAIFVTAMEEMMPFADEVKRIRPELIKLNQVGIKHLRRFLQFESDAENLKAGFVRYLAMTAATPYEDIAPACKQVIDQAVAIKNEALFCQTLTGSGAVIPKIKDARVQSDVIQAMFSTLEKRKIEKDYNARYYIANYVDYLPIPKRIATEWKFVDLLPIMSADGKSTNGTFLGQRVKGMPRMDMHREFRRTLTSWLTQQQAICGKARPDVYPL